MALLFLTREIPAKPPTMTESSDVASVSFKNFMSQQMKHIEKIHTNIARTDTKKDMEIKLNDLEKSADSFELNSPVPSDIILIIAKDPAKQT